MILYDLNDIEKRYDGKTALTIDRLTVEQGAILGLAGPNGSGKSTLLKLLGFVARPSQGVIRFKGRPSSDYGEAVRKQVTLLTQESYMLKRSVFKNVAYGLKLRKAPGDPKPRVVQALNWVGLDYSRFAERPWFALSGGEARRVALAARLVLRPDVLLLDEPTSSVDDVSAEKIKMAAMRAHRQWGATLVIASHDLFWLRDSCDDILYLLAGRPAGTGQPTFIYGPWQACDSGLVCRALTDNQYFLASPRPHDTGTAVAAIDAGCIHLIDSNAEPPGGYHGLNGTLVSLSFQRTNNRVMASVQVGATVFGVELEKNKAGKNTMQPGRQVTLVYRPEDICWHC